MQTIFVWPDYTWMDEDDWRRSDESGFDSKSDDYMVLDIPDEIEDIDAWLQENKPQG